MSVWPCNLPEVTTAHHEVTPYTALSVITSGGVEERTHDHFGDVVRCEACLLLYIAVLKGSAAMAS